MYINIPMAKAGHIVKCNGNGVGKDTLPAMTQCGHVSGMEENTQNSYVVYLKTKETSTYIKIH